MISRLTVLTAALALTWTAAACSSSTEGTSEETDDAEPKAIMNCQYGETRVKLGASVPAVDGCNERTCNEANNGTAYVTCTGLACAPACKPVVCELFCADGFRKDADGCEICACQ